MAVSFADLEFGRSYDRPFLAQLWGYDSFHALSKGVVTPAATHYIILFVTKQKQESLPQYNDYVDGNLLFWEGEEKHSSDRRVIDAQAHDDEVHLFYRETHHTPFTYFGTIHLAEHQLRDTIPSQFVFVIDALPSRGDVLGDIGEHQAEYRTLPSTEREALMKSRIGQGEFRENLIRLWGSCAITGLQDVTLLRASHIKPWNTSTNSERLTPYNGLLLVPNYDLLLDAGLIAFRNDGSIMISARLNASAQGVFRVGQATRLRRVFPQNKEFLEYHRDVVFK